MSSNSLEPAHAAMRSHHKSRRGCRTCKARRVKCDERRPLCQKCAKRFPGIESCDFDSKWDVVAPGRHASTASCPIQPRIVYRRHDYDGNGAGTTHSRLLELRLMHHYTEVTCGQLPKNGHDIHNKSIWSLDIPRLAFESDLVLSALLGLSSLHLSALSPDDRRLRYASNYYFGKAVKEHRTALVHVSDESAEPLLATAILITHHAWIAAHTASPDEPYELPLKTYYMARGIQHLFIQMAPSITGSGLLWFVRELPEGEVEDDGCKSNFFDCCQRDLDKISCTLDSLDVNVNDKVVYEATVAELSSLYSAIRKRAPQDLIQRRVATMPLILPRRFLELVELKDPLAMALLARNLAMLKIIDDVWWLHGTGDYEVANYSVNGIRSLMPSEWLWAMEWPLTVVNGSVTPRLWGDRQSGQETSFMASESY